MKQTKPRGSRSFVPIEFLGAFKKGHRFNTKNLIDEDLAHTLLNKVLKDNCAKSREALAFMARFNNEYYKNFLKKNNQDKAQLHKTDAQIKDCFDRYNARKKDVASEHTPILTEGFLNERCFKHDDFNHEDVIIELLDRSKRRKKNKKHRK